MKRGLCGLCGFVLDENGRGFTLPPSLEQVRALYPEATIEPEDEP